MTPKGAPGLAAATLVTEYGERLARLRVQAVSTRHDMPARAPRASRRAPRGGYPPGAARPPAFARADEQRAEVPGLRPQHAGHTSGAHMLPVAGRLDLLVDAPTRLGGAVRAARRTATPAAKLLALSLPAPAARRGLAARRSASGPVRFRAGDRPLIRPSTGPAVGGGGRGQCERVVDTRASPRTRWRTARSCDRPGQRVRYRTRSAAAGTV